ncbi:hypothetical protein PoB_007157600 [Plakobranchus ocellatus]|uniref:Uncharacterized protein n=1 Tax=Plakobranchus ocellatus TaxID=259542 RepID=A0AAV4DM93_9GAST|nr:hypothetical protein PoB_007157600 [Plakobranchus ocellatus]
MQTRDTENVPSAQKLKIAAMECISSRSTSSAFSCRARGMTDHLRCVCLVKTQLLDSSPTLQIAGQCVCASPLQGDIGFSGPPLGQSAGGEARTRDRRVPADPRVDSLSIVLPTPRERMRSNLDTTTVIWKL